MPQVPHRENRRSMLGALLLATGWTLSAADLYVAPNGSATPPYASVATAAKTIQAAVIASAAGDVIRVQPGTYSENVTLTKAVSLVGSGMHATCIDGATAGSCLTINAPGATVTVQDLHLRSGQAAYGGGVNANGGTVRLERVWVDRCQGGRGGGIYAQNTVLALVDSVVSRCDARTELGTDAGKGGGLYLVSNLSTARATLSGSVFYGNHAIYGGALRLWEAAAELRQCQFFHNRAVNAVVDITEFSDVSAADLLIYRNATYAGTVVTETNDSQMVLAYTTLADNLGAEGYGPLFEDVYSNLAWWNSAAQRNTPDAPGVNPATVLGGNVFSTVPAGFTGLTAVTASFATGDDGAYYLGATSTAASPFWNAGNASCPLAVIAAARKLCANGAPAPAGVHAGYGFPTGTEGTLQLTPPPGLAISAHGVPGLLYSLDSSADAAFAAPVTAQTLGHLGPQLLPLTIPAAAGNTCFYRLRGNVPQGNVLSVVVRTTGGIPLAGQWVDLFLATAGTWMAGDITDANGACTLPNLPDGAYKILAGAGNPVYVPQYLGNTASVSAATVITLANDATSGPHTIALPTGATITGRAVDVRTSQGIVGATVSALNSSDGTTANSAVTDGTGAFTIGGLAAGTYTVAAVKAPLYPKAYWAGQPAITLTATQTRVLATPIQLTANGKVTGSVTVSDGGRVFALPVVLYDSTDYSEIDYTFPDALGHYELYAPAGAYIISAGENSRYVTGYSGTLTLSAATPITQDFTLVPGGNVSGMVLDARQQGIASLYVDFYSGTPADGLTYVDSAYTLDDGTYTSPKLPPGNYYVQVYGEPSYTSPWYVNATYPEDATGVPVSVDAQTTRIDITVKLR